MGRIAALALGAALLVLPLVEAHALVKAGPGIMRGLNVRMGPATAAEVIPPLDGLTTPTGAYGFRKLRTAYAGNAVRIRRASDNAEIDVGFLGFVPGLGAPWDEATANAHCTTTTCFLRTWYDQSGGALNMEQATAASQPALVFNCNGWLPCLQTTTAAQLMATVGTVTPGTTSISLVATRFSGTGICTPFRLGGTGTNRVQTQTANNWLIGGASGTITAAAADAAWHSGQGVINGAASTLSIDGVTGTGTVTSNTATGSPTIIGIAAATCRWGEAVFWNSYALTPAEQTALTNNQRSFWGF